VSRSESIIRFTQLAGRRARREARRQRWARREQPLISDYLRRADIRKLQVGAGPNVLPGWLNTDRDPSPGQAYLDATRRFPLPDRSMHYIFAEHTVEHFTYDVGKRMLRECHRVLVPGGRIRICTPDMRAVFALLDHDGDGSIEARYTQWSIRTFLPAGTPTLPAFAVNQVFRGWGHRFIYDSRSLDRALRTAGFTDVSEYRMGESGDDHLRGIDSHGATPEDQEFIRFETLAMEAIRPA
jgi:hypothetical protein